MDATILPIWNALYEVLKDRPDLFISALILMYALSERAERKTMSKQNLELTSKMHEQNTDTNELLGQIKFLLELLTKGRR